MKRIYLIGGTMGVGKTTVCVELKRRLQNCVFLDGDWCWDASPFCVTDETKAIVMDNICHLLNNFIHCSAYDNIVFCWVMHEQSIIDDILKRLDTGCCDVKAITLIVNEENLRSRLGRDIQNGLRSEDIIDRSVKRLPLYHSLDTIKIDTSNKTVSDVAEEIMKLGW